MKKLIKQKGRKGPGDISLISIPKSPAMMACRVSKTIL